jgi:apolipoprotein N-acyltransferase
MAKSGRRREWGRATDDTYTFPAVADDDAEPGDREDDPQSAESDKIAEVRSRLKRFGQRVVDRLPQLSVAIVAGLALCVSFPPFGWWYLAIAAFGLLAWVLTRESTALAGGFGYGFLFGLAFYLPLLPWIGGFVGAFPWFVLCVLEALFPAFFGLTAVAARRRSAWPFWFAALLALEEGLKSTVPFGGFPGV